MSGEDAAANRVYAALKREILSGRFRPGAPLSLQCLARDIGTSVSPVRHALARLVGERIVETHAGGGFQYPMLREKVLRDLYHWHAHLIRLVLRDRKSGCSVLGVSSILDGLEELDTFAIADATSALFCRIAEGSDDIEHVEAVRSANDRLHATRIAETDIPDRVAELRAVASATADGSRSAARAVIWSYHRRRLRRIGDIARAAGGSPTAPSGPRSS